MGFALILVIGGVFVGLVACKCIGFLFGRRVNLVVLCWLVCLFSVVLGNGVVFGLDSLYSRGMSFVLPWLG